MNILSFYSAPLAVLLLLNGCSMAPYRHSARDQVYGVFGDCYASGAMANPLTNSFANLTDKALEQDYPGTLLINLGEGGVNSTTYDLLGSLDKIKKANHGPLTRAVLTIGVNNLTTVYEGCTSCSFTATDAEALEVSWKFKEEYRKMIRMILNFSPQCQLIILTLPDPNNGGKGTGGPYRPVSALKYDNDRIRELAGEEHVMLVDSYQILMGHLDWWVEGDRHPNNKGHAAITQAIEEKFGVYHPVISTPTVTALKTAPLVPASTAVQPALSSPR